MRVSIWQQFASDNSNSFVVVGHFETVAAAQHVAFELDRLLRAIATWHEQHPDGWQGEPSPPEVEAAQHYGVAWEAGHDWLDRGPDMVSSLLTTWDTCVFLNTPWHFGTTGYRPFDEIIAKLGGTPVVGCAYESSEIEVNLTCTAPDHQTAQHLYTILDPYFKDSYLVAIPWIAYVGGQKHPHSENLQRLETATLENQRLTKAIWALEIQIQKAAAKHDEAKVQALRMEIQSLHEQELHHQSIVEFFSDSPDKSLFDLALNSTRAYWGTVERDHLTLRLTQVSFLHQIGFGLPAMIAWLRDEGCRDIEFSFHQVEVRMG
jgi:hypothetical protein